jgi:hypothetical protein
MLNCSRAARLWQDCQYARLRVGLKASSLSSAHSGPPDEFGPNVRVVLRHARHPWAAAHAVLPPSNESHATTCKIRPKCLCLEYIARYISPSPSLKTPSTNRKYDLALLARCIADGPAPALDPTRPRMYQTSKENDTEKRPKKISCNCCGSVSALP